MITMTISPYQGIGSAPQPTQAFKAILRAKGNFHPFQIDLPSLLLRGSSDSVCCRPKACHPRPCPVRGPKWLLTHHLRLPIFLAWNVAPRVKGRVSSANERKIHEVLQKDKYMRERKKRTVYSSTPFLILSSSRLLRFLFDEPTPRASSFATSTARLFFPATSSAMRCCLSAGVSVQRLLSPLFTGPLVRANWRALSFVVSRSMKIELV